MTIEELIKMLDAISQKRQVVFGFHLHDGIRKFIESFDDIEKAIDFLEQVKDSESPSFPYIENDPR